MLVPLALLGLIALTACGPPPRTSQSLAAAQPIVASPAAPKTLESTLRLGPDVEDISFYPQIAESAHGDIVAVWEQFDGARYSIWGNSRRKQCAMRQQAAGAGHGRRGQGRAGRFDTTASHRRGGYMLLI